MKPTDPLLRATAAQRDNIARAIAEEEHVLGEFSSGGKDRYRERRLGQLAANPDHFHVLEHIAGHRLTPVGWDRVDFTEISRTRLCEMLGRAFEAGASAERSRRVAQAPAAAAPAGFAGQAARLQVRHPAMFALLCRAADLAQAVATHAPSMADHGHPSRAALDEALVAYQQAARRVDGTAMADLAADSAEERAP